MWSPNSSIPPATHERGLPGVHVALLNQEVKSMKLRFTALLVALLCLSLWSSDQALAKGKRTSDPATTAEAKFAVLSPLGIPPAIKLSAMAPRLNTLDGKTIYIVDDGFVGGDVLLKEMAAWFNRNMPSVNVVYRRKAGGFPDEDPALWAEIKAKGDAVIMGVGH
jgi:hypothetical protein